MDEPKQVFPGPLTAQNLTQLVYLLQALGFLIGITWLVAVVINYVKLDDVRGTWMESHFRWQIRTFWFGLLLGGAGCDHPDRRDRHGDTHRRRRLGDLPHRERLARLQCAQADVRRPERVGVGRQSSSPS